MATPKGKEIVAQQDGSRAMTAPGQVKLEQGAKA